MNSFEPDPEPLRNEQYDSFQQELWRVLIARHGSQEAAINATRSSWKGSSLCALVEDAELRDNYIEAHIDDEDVVKKKLAKRLNAIIEKERAGNGKGYWDVSPQFRGVKNYKAVMWRNIVTEWRPDTMKQITAREQMRLMGLPEDMDVPRAYPNAISQNVPTCTAAWVTSEIVAALNNDRPVWDGENSLDGILRQNNINKKVFK